MRYSVPHTTFTPGPPPAQVARLVYDSAVAAFPGSLPLRLHMLQALAQVGLPGSSPLERHMRGGIATDFAHDAAAWDLRARHALVPPPLRSTLAGTGASCCAPLCVQRPGMCAAGRARLAWLPVMLQEGLGCWIAQ